MHSILPLFVFSIFTMVSALVSLARADSLPVSVRGLSERTTTTEVIVEGRRYHLETIVIRPNDRVARPLVVISHGNPRDVSDARRIRLLGYHAVAEDFARRGYVAAIFARRGFGKSTGEYSEYYGSCTQPNYLKAMKVTAADYRSFIKAISKRNDVDGNTVIAIGQSGGGVGVLALGADAPRGLRAVINFSGVRGSTVDGKICARRKLISSVSRLGSTGSPPSLWLYSSTDNYIGPNMVRDLVQHYRANGGRAQLQLFGSLRHFADGHRLISRGNRPLWRPSIDDFLNSNGLQNWIFAPTEHAVLERPPPSGLSENGRRNWMTYLGSDLNKAFAKSVKGSRFGWVSRRASRKDAIADALSACQGDRENRRCRIISVNDEFK